MSGLVTMFFYRIYSDGVGEIILNRKLDVPGTPWALPGGTIKNNEDPPQVAAIRETNEEVGSKFGQLLIDDFENIAVMEIERLGKKQAKYTQTVFVCPFPNDLTPRKEGYLEMKKREVREELGPPMVFSFQDISSGKLSDEDGEFPISALHRDTIWRVAQSLSCCDWNCFDQLAEATEKFAFK